MKHWFSLSFHALHCLETAAVTMQQQSEKINQTVCKAFLSRKHETYHSHKLHTWPLFWSFYVHLITYTGCNDMVFIFNSFGGLSWLEEKNNSLEEGTFEKSWGDFCTNNYSKTKQPCLFHWKIKLGTYKKWLLLYFKAVSAFPMHY